MSIGQQLLGFQPILITIIGAIYILLILMDKDELEQFALSSALKISTLIITIFVFGYSLYVLSLGRVSISINSILYIIEGMCVLTFLLYFLELKGISFEMKFKNKGFSNILMYISTIISIMATLSIMFELEFFENKIGFIRYDELILFVNTILLAMIIPLLPKRKKVNHKEYKRIKADIDKTFNIIGLIYFGIMILVISYTLYQKLAL